jgi:uncharacterized protein (DUF2267 family)
LGDAARPRLAEAGLWEAFGMDYQEIIELIGREAGGLPDEAAERAAEAVLRVLAARLPRGRRDACFRSCPPR